MTKDLFDELSSRLAGLISTTSELGQEARIKVEKALKHGLKDLDVLTREEFDGQARALARAQQRMTKLETLIGHLESRLDSLERQHED